VWWVVIGAPPVILRLLLVGGASAVLWFGRRSRGWRLTGRPDRRALL